MIDEAILYDLKHISIKDKGDYKEITIQARQLTPPQHLGFISKDKCKIYFNIKDELYE